MEIDPELVEKSREAIRADVRTRFGVALEMEPVHLPAVVLAALDSIRPAATAKGIRLVEDLQPAQQDQVVGQPVSTDRFIAHPHRHGDALPQDDGLAVTQQRQEMRAARRAQQVEDDERRDPRVGSAKGARWLHDR